jgi:hypothetical protein
MRDDLQRRIADGTSPLTTYAQMAAISGHDTRPACASWPGSPRSVLHGLDDLLVPPDRARELGAADSRGPGSS